MRRSAEGNSPASRHLGYLNDHRTKKIVIDKERAPFFVREAFELYATGKATLEDVRVRLAERNIRTAGGRMLIRAHVSKMLSNPFYYGHFRYVGEVHVGSHEPIISKSLFDQADGVFKRRWRYSPSEKKAQNKPFLGLLHCGECGGAITGEVQKGYTYYRCTKKGRLTCNQPYIREEALDAEISGLLKPFVLRVDWADEMLKRVKEEKRQSAQSSLKLAALKRVEVEKINHRLQRLLDSLLDGLVDRETYAAKKSDLMSQRKTLEEQKDACLAGRADWLEPFQKWILTARNAGETMISGSLQEKRVLALKVFGSNLVLDCKKARGSCVKPWSLLVEQLVESWSNRPGGWNRTTGGGA